jgi:thioesterase domain-containing protein
VLHSLLAVRTSVAKRVVEAKISPEFAQRLARLGPDKRVRALLMLDADPRGAPRSRRPSAAERTRAAEKLVKAADRYLPEIDRVLEQYQGKRLAARANALGAVPIVAPAAALRALAGSAHVTAILEDQEISLLKG